MKAIIIAALVLLAASQQAGNNTAETHPPLQVSVCTGKGSCSTKSSSVTLDSNWRWLHKVGGTNNCYTGNTWDTSICTDPTACAKNCALDGAEYSGTYGITSSGNALTLKFVTHGPYSTNIGSRVYLMDGEDKYQVFKLVGQEFSFDVDVSNLPCGLNGALYFVEMPADGDKGKGNNAAGPKFGTGYCDGQCPHDMKFISGEANILNWKPNPDDKNAGSGKYGTCCGEMDVWEANSQSTAYTAHDCSKTGLYRCSGTDCGDIETNERYKGVCDKDGCDMNPFRLGVKDFYGKGQIDTSKPFSVITQFVGSGSSLSEIRRLWKQGGTVIANPPVTVSGKQYDSLSDSFCTAEKTLFGDVQDFSAKGGMAAHGAMLNRGVVLVMSLWDDHYAHMLWLDSNYPTDKDPSTPGVARGPCGTDTGKPDDVESRYASSSVIFSNIRWGPINSTFF